MDDTRCKETVYGNRGWHHQCTNKAGYGPDKKYCKIHARQKGEKIGQTIILYRVYSDWSDPLHIAEIEAEVTKASYLLNNSGLAFECARRLSIDEASKLGIFATKEEALVWYVNAAGTKVANLRKALEKAEEDEREAVLFANKSGIDWMTAYAKMVDK